MGEKPGSVAFHSELALLPAQAGQGHRAVQERHGVRVLRQAPGGDAHGHFHADHVPVVPHPVQGHKAAAGFDPHLFPAIDGDHCLSLDPPGRPQVQGKLHRSLRFHGEHFGPAVGVAGVLGGVLVDILPGTGGAGEMEASRKGVPGHGKGHRPALYLHLSGKVKILGHIQLALLLVENPPLPGGIPLDQGAVAAEKVVGLAGPALVRAGSQGKEIGEQPLVGGVVVLAVRLEPLPVSLGHQTVVDAHLDVVGVAGVLGPAEQVVRQPEHIVHGAVFLILVPQPGAQKPLGGPDLPACLAAGGVLAPLVHRQLPVGLHNVPPALLPGDLIGSGAAQHLRDGGVGVHVGEHVFPLQQGIEQPAAVVAVHQLPILVLAGVVQQLDPDLQHAPGLKVQDVVKLLPGEGAGPLVEPVGETVGHFQGFPVPGQLVHVHQAHKGLVEVVLGSPHLFAPGNPVQVLLRDGTGPLAAVVLLAQGQLVDNGIGLGLDLPVPCGVVPHGRRGQPMPQEMAPKLAGLCLPAPVDSLRQVGRGEPAGFQLEIQHQIFRLQVHHILAVPAFPAQKLLFPQGHIRPPNCFQHFSTPPFQKSLCSHCT